MKTNKLYVKPVIEIIVAKPRQAMMEWFSTNVSEDPIENDDIGAKQGFFDDYNDFYNRGKQFSEKTWNDNLWEE